MPLNIRDLAVSSPDFPPGGALDARFSQDGGNETPRLTITGIPEGTVELALICHDPDAPLAHGFTHWVLYGLPPEPVEVGPAADRTYRPGPNSAGLYHWVGPQPPAGHGVHHYYFWVYALDTAVEGTPTREEFLTGYAAHILEQAPIMGTFENPV